MPASVFEDTRLAKKSSKALQIDEIVLAVEKLKPQAVFIVGDMVDAYFGEDILERLEPLFAMAARLPTYYVTGNHDYFFGDAELLLRHYEKQGIHVLRNRCVFYSKLFRRCQNVSGISVAGVYDSYGARSG